MTTHNAHKPESSPPATTSLPHLLTMAEVAERLRVSRSTVCKVATGRVRGTPVIPSVLLGRRRLFRETDVADWLSKNASGSVVR